MKAEKTNSYALSLCTSSICVWGRTSSTVEPTIAGSVLRLDYISAKKNNNPGKSW